MEHSDATHETQEETFARLLRDYGAALARLVNAYEEDLHERQDLLQDIAFAIWRALPSFRGDCSERTFVFRIGHNRGLTHRKRRSIRRSTPLEEVGPLEDPRVSPERDLLDSQRYDRLNRAVRALAPIHREAVMLRLEGLSNREAAAVLGTTENSVAIRLTRARKALAGLLELQGDE